MAKKEQKTKVNEFGVPLFIDRSNKSQLRERVRILKLAVEQGCPVGSKKPLSQKDIKRAKMHIGWYVNLLKNSGKRSSKKAS